MKNLKTKLLIIYAVAQVLFLNYLLWYWVVYHATKPIRRNFLGKGY